MNKLIQEIAYESARAVEANLMAQDPAFVEKFAMMIVRECCEQVGGTAETEIRKHFGLEE
jgi:hypothetical protein